MPELVLLRHGQSQWNLENRFTGWHDCDLSDRGREEARRSGELLQAEGLLCDVAYTSLLKRAIRTLWIAMDVLDTIIADGDLTARGVYGLFPAASVGDDIEVRGGAGQDAVAVRIPGLRQQFAKADGRPNLALADFVAPRESGREDWVGAFVVTAGHGVAELCDRFERDHDDYRAILVRALADRLAEAFAEWLHEKVRKHDWGYAGSEELEKKALIREEYRGIRPAPGYPACPDHSVKRTLFDLLDAERHTGVSLTDSFAMLPASSVACWYFSHPAATYFGVGRVGRDQVEDYAGRNALTVSEGERWLAPNLSYDRSGSR